MKLVIADDESLVRVSLASMIKDMDAAWQVAEAASGEELLRVVAEQKPNIAIVDIRMPKMDGIEAIRAGKTLSPVTNWVILSGFSDFAYAQQALRLGVSEYLLKPVAPAELEKALLHIYKDNKDYISLLNQQFENHLFALCNGLATLKYEERDSLFYRGRFAGRIFIQDASSPAGRLTVLERELYEELRELADRHLVYGMNAALLALPGGEMAAVAAWDPGLGQTAREQAGRFLERATETAGRRCGGERLTTVLATDDCQGFEAMNAQLKQLAQWADLRAVCGAGRQLAYKELAREAASPDKLEAGRLLGTITDHFRNGMHLQYQSAVGSLEMLLGKSRLFENGAVREAARHFCRFALGLDLPRDAPGAFEPEELRKLGERALCGAKEPAPANLVDQVLQYIDKHYTDDIGIGQIAGELNVSVTYLSTLFHKKTGVTFIKYLTRIRMLQAKELLLNTNLHIKQVAERVGYYSTRHFTKLFTETFGKYPSDCRKVEKTGE
ncbi:response regulator transcription factor [Paenibacillus humicola]|uniref:response regulator transcription factor n=1 Tax=Paenibacillus humicola TaxID=3110540 RepID=UPI00237AAC25|nr:response regulator [Paenibacillus humicola]